MMLFLLMAMVLVRAGDDTVNFVNVDDEGEVLAVPGVVVVLLI